jgi:hypothetical protein
MHAQQLTARAHTLSTHTAPPRLDLLHKSRAHFIRSIYFCVMQVGIGLGLSF